MLLSLLVAELVLLGLIVVERWVHIPPFNDLALARRLPFLERLAPTLRAAAPVLVALIVTTLEIVQGPTARQSTVVAAALVFAAIDAARAVWIPWYLGRPSASWSPTSSDAHAVLEPRQPKAAVPTTLQCVQHAQVVACVAMALVVGIAPHG